MDIRKIDETIAVSPQIQPDDIREIAALGYRTVIANRPDQEEFGQPLMSEIEAAAKEHGLQWIYQPVESGNIFDRDVEQFGALVANAEKPILAFCRSGTRCCALWAMSNAKDTPADALIIKARAAGYDLSGLKPRLLQQTEQS
ncbi:TIGR01244 family sulfur transferase [Marinobacter sp. SS21]|uniref:TIGR01244 family sulfur transferase n=1 Tax=Marinobacter sp. SS21 TaxID=2979460 RepID=UPI00232ECD4E|nr:TIGR01244 family sulfur transferase [Marinobacter sp. SS21]MDC0661823.1 TIGR01244 family sulfur transferase [Marinobacter sp. SS21]